MPLFNAPKACQICSKFMRDDEGLGVQGRQHAVEVFYTATQEESYIDAAVVAAVQVGQT